MLADVTGAFPGFSSPVRGLIAGALIGAMLAEARVVRGRLGVALPIVAAAVGGAVGVHLRESDDVEATLRVGGVARSISTTEPGAGATLRFRAEAGSVVIVKFTDIAIDDRPGCNTASVQLIDGGRARVHATVGTSRNASLGPTALLRDGAAAIRVRPTSDDTMRFTIAVREVPRGPIPSP